MIDILFECGSLLVSHVGCGPDINAEKSMCQFYAIKDGKRVPTKFETSSGYNYKDLVNSTKNLNEEYKISQPGVKKRLNSY